MTALPAKLRATPGRFFTPARPQRAWVACQAQQQPGAPQTPQPESSRRAVLLGGAALLAAPLLASRAAVAAENAAVVQGLNRYIKKKKYDDIESYLPALIAAQGQLVRSGYLMAQDPNAARLMLREGAFSGLRDNVRAVGEYAAQQGRPEEGAQLVAGVFKALEGYDYTLLQGSRSQEGLDQELGQQKLKEASDALDRLLAVVPEGMVTRARGIVEDLESDLEAAREARAAQAEEALRQQEEELKKLL